MATDIYLIGSDASEVHLVNSASGTPTPGGSPSAASTTPFGIRGGWVPTEPDRLDNFVDEVIPLIYLGSSVDLAQDHLDLLRNLVVSPLTGNEALVIQPNGASSPVSYGIYFISRVQASGWEGTQTSPAEGSVKYFIDVSLRRTAQPGVTIFEALGVG